MLRETMNYRCFNSGSSNEAEAQMQADHSDGGVYTEIPDGRDLSPCENSYRPALTSFEGTSVKNLILGTSSLKVFYKEALQQYHIAVPMIITSLLQSLYPIISLMFVGHLGARELSASALANSFSIVTGYTVMLGLSSGLETLCGQLYGAQQYHMMGVYLQASVMVLCVLAVPISILWLNMEALFVLLGQDKVISAIAGNYFKWLIPSLFANAILQPILKFLQSQGEVRSVYLASLVATGIHIPLCAFFVYKSSLATSGGALAVSVTCWMNLMFILAYIFIMKVCPDTWTGWSKEAFPAAKFFLKLGVPAAFMICLEYWSFEIMVLLSGLLENPEVETSVLGICVNTETLQYMLPFGFGMATSTRVGNELGAGHPDGAKFAIDVALRITLIQSGALSLIFFLLRDVWGGVFSSDAAVIRKISQMMPLVTFTIFFDGIQGVLSGAVRGCARQRLGAYINFATFYVVGIPMALLLGLRLNMNSKGLWGGLALGLFLQTCALFVITLKVRWKDMVEDARKRTSEA